MQNIESNFQELFLTDLKFSKFVDKRGFVVYLISSLALIVLKYTINPRYYQLSLPVLNVCVLTHKTRQYSNRPLSFDNSDQHDVLKISD